MMRVSRKWVGFLPEAPLSGRLTIPLCDSKFLCETRSSLWLKFLTPNHREHRGTQRKTHRGRRHEPSSIGSYKRTVVCPRISRAEPCGHFRKSFRCRHRTSSGIDCLRATEEYVHRPWRRREYVGYDRRLP